MVGYLIAAPTLVAAARLGSRRRRDAKLPTAQLPIDTFDLSDLLTLAATPTNALLTVTVNPRRHRVVRPPARRGRPGHHDGDRDDHRRRDGPADRQGQGHARRRAPGAAVQPAHRRLEHDARALRAGAHRRGRARAAGSSATAARELGVDASQLRLDGRRRSPRPTARTRLLRRRSPRRPRSPRRRRSSRALKARAAQTLVGTDAAPRRRARHRHRPQAVRDGPQGPGRAADDDLPPADDQRPRARDPQPRDGQGDAGRHRRRCSSRTTSSSRAASRCAAKTFGQCIDAVRALKVTLEPGHGRRASPTADVARRPEDDRAAADARAARAR